MKKRISLSFEQMKIAKDIGRVQHIIDKEMEGKKNLLIYGAKMSTVDFMLEYLELSDYEIRFCDGKFCGKFNNREVFQPSDDLYDWADGIVITSFSHGKEIYEELKGHKTCQNKIIQIYTNNINTPFGYADIEMNADKLFKERTSFEEVESNNKYKAWQYEGSGEVYENAVEKNFFNAVLKNYYLEYISEGDKVLDIGAGTGRLSCPVYEKCGDVTAVYTSAEMLKVLSEKQPLVKTVLVDSEKLPFDNETFDKVLSCDAMIHFVNWKDFLKEHSRVLKSGGIIVYNMVNDDHLREISKNREIRGWYMASYSSNHFYATVTKTELERACSEIGNLKLEAMIPYEFFAQTAYVYGILTHDEGRDFCRNYKNLFQNESAKEVLVKFEKEIVSKLPGNMTHMNLVVIKKG